MIVIDRWAGLVTNASPYSLPPGAAVTQVNLQVLAPGQLAVRPGLQAASFAAFSASSSPVRVAFRCPGAVDSILYQTQGGSIFIATGPS